MLGCLIEMQMAAQREGLTNAVNGLREGSVLDVLCPQSKTVTVDKPTQPQAIGMLYCHLITCTDVQFLLLSNSSFRLL